MPHFLPGLKGEPFLSPQRNSAERCYGRFEMV